MRTLDDAMLVAEGSSPTYARGDYEDAMLDIAKAEARAGECTASAFARLCDEGDERVSALFVAARQAEAEERARAHDEHFRAVDSGQFSVEMAKRAGAKAELMQRMEKHAAATKLRDETDAEAFSRALQEDAAMHELYAQYRAT